jgi:hypothetical protein
MMNDITSTALVPTGVCSSNSRRMSSSVLKPENLTLLTLASSFGSPALALPAENMATESSNPNHFDLV